MDIETELWNSYLIDGTNILKNKLGINNKQELDEAERLLSLKKLTYLYINPVQGNLDIKHVKEIHKTIFEDIYPFAGKFRISGMSKNYDNFSKPEEIEIRLEALLNFMNENISKIKSEDELAFFLAPAYYEMIMIHPFREGNGRMTREFFREFVELKTNSLSFGLRTLDMTKFDINNLLMGVKERFILPRLLENEFMRAIVPLNIEKTYKNKRWKYEH